MNIYPKLTDRKRITEFCLADGNQATVAAIKSTWLPLLDQVRTALIES
jgi:hypothetical protein